MVRDRESTLIGILCGAGAGALWGLVFLAPELARAFSPLELTIGRYLAYGAISALLIAPNWRTLTAKLGRREWLALGWLALAGNTIYYILLSSAVQMGGIAMTSLVIGFLPVAVRSRHWIAEPRFAQALRDWCAQETAAVRRQRQALLAHNPFRAEDIA